MRFIFRAPPPGVRAGTTGGSGARAARSRGVGSRRIGARGGQQALTGGVAVGVWPLPAPNPERRRRAEQAANGRRPLYSRHGHLRVLLPPLPFHLRASTTDVRSAPTAAPARWAARCARPARWCARATSGPIPRSVTTPTTTATASWPTETPGAVASVAATRASASRARSSAARAGSWAATPKARDRWRSATASTTTATA